MEAMILAAGLGTRLRPITERIPKALVPVLGRPLLAHVMDRLVAAGATRIIVNAHHHSGQIAAFLGLEAPPDLEVALSDEPDGPYDTGGGLVAAAPMFRRDGAFILHNVDVLSRIPLDRLVADHHAARERSGAPPLATLAVQDREARRRLLFDAEGLVGWEERVGDGSVLESRRAREPVGPVSARAFSGIHVLEPGVLDLPHPAGAFPIVAWYLELAGRGHRIEPADVSGHEWLEVGTPARLAEAEERCAKWPA